MRGISLSVFLPIVITLFLIELIAFIGLYFLLKNSSSKLKTFFSITYWIISFTVLGILLYSFSNPDKLRNSSDYQFFYFAVSVIMLNLIPKLLISFGTLFSLVIRIFTNRHIQKVLLTGTLLISLGVLIIMGAGLTWGKKMLRIVENDIWIRELPKQLSGLKIVQISDIHLGCYENDKSVIKEMVSTINQLNPDFVLFTGDIVNNFSNEIDGYESLFRAIKCKYGKYAIMGNHDYGDYSNWPDSLSKAKNLSHIKKGIREAGFDLLLNESRKITIEDTSIYIIGVENWGHPPFPQYANLKKAMEGIPEKSVKILLSHDPAHWQAKVVDQSNIQLTLSGHSHGGQLGIRIAGIVFSPIYFNEKHWGGQYKHEDQYLYVNRGLGCVGFNGRIGMNPEITLLTIYKQKSR